MTKYSPWPLPERFEMRQIDFQREGGDDTGFLSIATQSAELGLEMERVFWTYSTPTNVERGGHAHFQTQELLIALRGEIEVTLEWPNGEHLYIVMSNPNRAVYIPPYAWRTFRYSENALQLVLASTSYDPEEYIRDREGWHRVYGKR